VEWHDDAPHLVMEYVDGESLQQAINQEGPLAFAVAAEHIAQAAAGLQHAHEKGFVHRDIKPGNLMRDRSGLVKILDMGLARSAADPDAARADGGAVFGTVDYISPEQALNGPDTDHRADIYSLGATLYALIAGKPPFEGSAAQKLMKHLHKDPPRLSETNPAVPQELSDVVSKMLAKKPSDRYQSAAEVIEALAPWAGDSAHVLAGVSRTGLGPAGSRTALRERLVGNSRRLAEVSPAGADPSAAPTEPGTLTAVFSSFETVSDSPRRGAARVRRTGSSYSWGPGPRSSWFSDWAPGSRSAARRPPHPRVWRRRLSRSP
jgi:serine/threonine protein kinase